MQQLPSVEVPEDYVPVETVGPVAEPEVVINHDRRIAEVKFPNKFLVHFQKPENTGERLVLKALARGLVGLHLGAEINIDDAWIETLLARVIPGSGMRVLHLFHTYYPIEHLLGRKNNKPVFLAHEDFVFAKLRLSEGCTTVKPEAVIKTKPECNEFLHKVVDKVWSQLRDLLHQFDRTSVIRRTIAIHEAIIQDRDHWRRTAQAVIALYSTADDVMAVAQEREQDRNRTALPARTILRWRFVSAQLGRPLSQWDVDELLAKAMLLIEVATDSDAIKLDLAGRQFNYMLMAIRRRSEFPSDCN